MKVLNLSVFSPFIAKTYTPLLTSPLLQCLIQNIKLKQQKKKCTWQLMIIWKLLKQKVLM